MNLEDIGPHIGTEPYITSRFEWADMLLTLIAYQTHFGITASIRNDWQAESHMHTDYEIHYIEKGMVKVGVSNQNITVHDGEFILIPPNCTHYVESQSDALLHIAFNFFIEYRGKKEGKDLGYTSTYDYYTSLLSSVKQAQTFRSNDLILLCCQRLINMSQSNESKPQIVFETLLNMLFVESLEVISQKVKREHRERKLTTDTSQNNRNDIVVHRRVLIDSYIENLYAYKISYEELARQMYLSRSQCIEVVKQLTGTTLHALIIKQRMMIAAHLIKTTSLKLAEIAIKVGYASYTGFYMAYKTFYGKYPDTERSILKSTSDSGK